MDPIDLVICICVNDGWSYFIRYKWCHTGLCMLENVDHGQDPLSCGFAEVSVVWKGMVGWLLFRLCRKVGWLKAHFPASF